MPTDDNDSLAARDETALFFRKRVYRICRTRPELGEFEVAANQCGHGKCELVR